MRETQQLPAVYDKLLMFGIGVLCFSLPLQSGFALLRMLHCKLN